MKNTKTIEVGINFYKLMKNHHPEFSIRHDGDPRVNVTCGLLCESYGTASH